MTLTAVLYLAARRTAEAAAVANDARLARNLASAIQRELKRQVLDLLQEPGRPAERSEVLRRLNRAALVVDVPRLDADGNVRHAVTLPSSRRPDLHLFALHLASTNVVGTEDGRFLVPLQPGERSALARLLGTEYELTSAAVRVDAQALARAARPVLQPGAAIAFLPGSSAFDAVRIVWPPDGDIVVERVPPAVPLEVQADPGGALDLGNAWDWPRLLFLGGREVKHHHYRREQWPRGLQHVHYFRDDVEEDGNWRGIAVAVVPQLHSDVRTLPAAAVASGAAALLAAWTLALCRLRVHMRPLSKTLLHPGRT